MIGKKSQALVRSVFFSSDLTHTFSHTEENNNANLEPAIFLFSGPGVYTLSFLAAILQKFMTLLSYLITQKEKQKNALNFNTFPWNKILFQTF